MKPGKARCGTRWNRQKATKIVADTVIKANGINRHVADGRRDDTKMEYETHGVYGETEICIGNMNEQDNDNLVHNEPEYSDSESASSDNASSDQVDEARPNRDRRLPRWLADFYVG